MNTLAWLVTTALVALIAWIVGFEQCWWQFVLPLREAKRTKPLGASAAPDCGYACEYVEPYGFVPEADCPVHDPPAEPKLERTIWLSVIDPGTRQVIGAKRVMIAQNDNPNARN